MILIDTSHLIMRNLFMNIYEIKENYNFLYHVVFQNILSFKRDFKASKENIPVYAFDSPNSWRKDFYEKNWRKLKDFPIVTGYKGQRKLDETIDWDKVFEIIENIYECLKISTDFKAIKIDKVEADDIIYVGVNEFYKKEPITIISSDKDFIQLLRFDNVKLYDPIKKKYREFEDPEYYLKKQIIIGDKVDNIPAIKKRVGEKTAEKWLDSGTFEEDLKTNKELYKRYKFNEKLIDLSKIPEKYYNQIKEKYEENDFNFDSMKLYECFKKFHLKKIFERINEFELRSESKLKKSLFG
jgi:ribosomal protein S17E